MPHPYHEFVELAATIRPPIRPDVVANAIAAAREAWAEVYAAALCQGGVPAGVYNLFTPAVDKLLGLAPDNAAVERLVWYRALFVILETRGLAEVAGLIRRGGDVLEEGGSLATVLAPSSNASR